MSLSETQQKLLDEICKIPGGTDINEAIQATGLDYKTIERTAYELVSKGYQVRALCIGDMAQADRRFRGHIKRLYLSPYDPKHEQLILKQEANVNV